MPTVGAVSYERASYPGIDMHEFRPRMVKYSLIRDRLTVTTSKGSNSIQDDLRYVGYISSARE